MTRIRPTEFKAVLALLSEECDSDVELATRVIETLDELRSKRTDYITVLRWSDEPPVMYFAFGPYVSENAARKDIERDGIQGLIQSAHGPRYVVLRLDTNVESGIEGIDV